MKIILNFNSITSFSTQRLLAIKIEGIDFDKFFMMDSNPQVMKTLGGVKSSSESQERLNWNLEQWKNNGFGLWMFYRKDTNEWVGRAGLRRIEVEGENQIEVAYAIMPKFWNEGYATEMAKACCEIAFEILDLKKIICLTLKENISSQQVMKKSGFHFQRDIIHHGLPHVLYFQLNPDAKKN